MHITKTKLKQIIKEEIQGVISEISPLVPGGSFPGGGSRGGIGSVGSGSPGLGAPSHDPDQVSDPAEAEAMLKSIKPDVLRAALDAVLGPHAPLREGGAVPHEDLFVGELEMIAPNNPEAAAELARRQALDPAELEQEEAARQRRLAASGH